MVFLFEDVKFRVIQNFPMHSFKGKTHQLSHCLPSKSLLIIASFTKKKNGFLEHILVAVFE